MARTRYIRTGPRLRSRRLWRRHFGYTHIDAIPDSRPPKPKLSNLGRLAIIFFDAQNVSVPKMIEVHRVIPIVRYP